MSLDKEILEDINDTCIKLVETDLAYSFQGVRCENLSGGIRRICWPNHISGTLNTSSYFNNLEQYKNILRNNAYFCMLYDGSIIRASYSIERNKLIAQNLLYWPAPFNLNLQNINCEFGGPLEILEDIMSSEDWHQCMIMRSPIRIDFDQENCSDEHPLIHLHIQDKDCRSAVNEPLCFNSFVRFIFENHYNQIYKKEKLFRHLLHKNLNFDMGKMEHSLSLLFKYK